MKNMMMTYSEWKQVRKNWHSQPIDPRCHVSAMGEQCRGRTVAAYPAMGGGWATLCSGHAKKHPEAFDTDELIRDGEMWRSPL